MGRLIVIGGGASGMMAALTAAENGCETLLLERNEKLGKKLYITGKGRCNVTNATPTDEFLDNVVRNPRFVRSCLARFSPLDLIALLEGEGVKTKLERGGRVFPASDKASDVTRALSKRMERAGVEVLLNTRVRSVRVGNGSVFIETDAKTFEAGATVIATGGASYPSTGSSGDGYGFAKALGHTVLPIAPALVGLKTKEGWPGSLAGLTLRNVTLACPGKRKTVTDVGELLFTHDGVSGPLALEMSSRVESIAGAKLTIDLKPGLTPETLDARVLRDLQKHARKRICNALEELLPKRLIPAVVAAAAIPDTAIDITREQRRALVEALKALPVHVEAPHGFNEAVITRGGVNVMEIDPKTMRSKLAPNIYFTGELLDIDALTGGFNLQLAFSTGYAAGLACTDMYI